MHQQIRQCLYFPTIIIPSRTFMPLYVPHANTPLLFLNWIILTRFLKHFFLIKEVFSLSLALFVHVPQSKHLCCIEIIWAQIYSLLWTLYSFMANADLSCPCVLNTSLINFKQSINVESNYFISLWTLHVIFNMYHKIVWFVLKGYSSTIGSQ